LILCVKNGKASGYVKDMERFVTWVEANIERALHAEERAALEVIGNVIVDGVTYSYVGEK
jgi:hypothetical protein